MRGRARREGQRRDMDGSREGEVKAGGKDGKVMIGSERKGMEGEEEGNARV